MIFDRVENAETYLGVDARIARGLNLLKQDFSQTPVGRYEVNEDLFYMIQEYETKPDNLAEAHRKYVDIQCMLNGAEMIAVQNVTKLTQVEAHPDKDLYLYNRKKGNEIVLTAGTFMVVWPQDAHAAAIAVDVPEKVRKVVVKVRIV